MMEDRTCDVGYEKFWPQPYRMLALLGVETSGE